MKVDKGWTGLGCMLRGWDGARVMGWDGVKGMGL